MGIASLILGIIGMLISLTIFKDLSLILCILALVLGIISIVKKKSKQTIQDLVQKKLKFLSIKFLLKKWV